MSAKTDKIEVKRCHHCGHEWEPRVKHPKKCPQCQNPLWVSPRPKVKKGSQWICRNCGRNMIARSGLCPICRNAQTSTEASEEAAPMPPTTATSTAADHSDVSGVGEEQLEPIYTRVEVDLEPESTVQRLQREADERLRRLADQPID
jgi:predicted Zn-ribbon and HTH transcriptional regulator